MHEHKSDDTLDVFDALIKKAQENLQNFSEAKELEAILKQNNLEMMTQLILLIDHLEKKINQHRQEFDLQTSSKLEQEIMELSSAFNHLNRALYMLHLSLLEKGQQLLIDAAFKAQEQINLLDPMLLMDKPKKLEKSLRNQKIEFTFPNQILLLMFFEKNKKVWDINKYVIPFYAWANVNPFINRLVCKYFADKVAPKNLLDMLVAHYDDDFKPKEIDFLKKNPVLLKELNAVINKKNPSPGLYGKKRVHPRDAAPKLVEHIEKMYQESLQQVVKPEESKRKSAKR